MMAGLQSAAGEYSIFDPSDTLGSRFLKMLQKETNDQQHLSRTENIVMLC